MALEYEVRTAGVILAVRVQPKARRTAILGEHNGSLKLAVAEPPQKGKANKAVVALLAQQFAVSKSMVEVISGHTSRSKRVLLRGMTKDQVTLKMAGIVEGLS